MRKYFWPILLVFLIASSVWGQSSVEKKQFEEYAKIAGEFAEGKNNHSADAALASADRALQFARQRQNSLLEAIANFYKGGALRQTTGKMANPDLGKEELFEAARVFIHLKEVEWFRKTIVELYVSELYNPAGISELAGYYAIIGAEIDAFGVNYKFPAYLRQKEPFRKITKPTILKVIDRAERNLKMHAQRGDSAVVMYHHENLSIFYQLLPDNQAAIRHLNASYEMAMLLKDFQFAVVALNPLTRLLLLDRKYDEARETTKRALNILQNVQMPQMKRLFLDYMYQILKEKGQHEAAYRYKEESYVLYDSLHDAAMLQNGAVIQEKLTAERKQFEAERLAQSQQQRFNYILIAMVALLLFSGGLIWYNIDLRKNKKELEIKNAEISAALLRGQTQERKRVASDLHDNLVSKMTGIRWRFQMIDKKELTPSNVKLYETVDQALEEALTDIRLISHNLLPAEFENKGLTAALQKLVNEINELGKTKFSLVTASPSVRFSPNLEFELYNIALELTTNILRHAQANAAELRLETPPNAVRFTITDDGLGFTVSPDKGGMGLRNVRARVSALSGTVAINNASGTNIQIIIPTPA